MSIQAPVPGDPRRPSGPRDSGDAWVVAPSGERYWGRYGAAGLLAIDPRHGVLLQHRVSWSHFGDTWALPGGARHEGESAVAAALRESAEEAGVPEQSIRPRLLSVLDLGYWSYATLVGDVVEPFEPTISDPESRELAWVRESEVDALPLHPGFAESWTRLRPLLAVRPVVVVDVANVMGSVPDGWWRDRRGAAERLLHRVAQLAAAGVAGSVLGLSDDVWFPGWRLVLEGAAKDLRTDAMGTAGGQIELVRAAGSGDDAIVDQAEKLTRSGHHVIVVTSDRGLGERATWAGAQVHSARWLLDLLP